MRTQKGEYSIVEVRLAYPPGVESVELCLYRKHRLLASQQSIAMPQKKGQTAIATVNWKREFAASYMPKSFPIAEKPTGGYCPELTVRSTRSVLQDFAEHFGVGFELVSDSTPGSSQMAYQ